MFIHKPIPSPLTDRRALMQSSLGIGPFRRKPPGDLQGDNDASDSRQPTQGPAKKRDKKTKPHPQANSSNQDDGFKDLGAQATTVTRSQGHSKTKSSPQSDSGHRDAKSGKVIRSTENQTATQLSKNQVRLATRSTPQHAQVANEDTSDDEITRTPQTLTSSRRQSRQIESSDEDEIEDDEFDKPADDDESRHEGNDTGIEPSMPAERQNMRGTRKRRQPSSKPAKPPKRARRSPNSSTSAPSPVVDESPNWAQALYDASKIFAQIRNLDVVAFEPLIRAAYARLNKRSKANKSADLWDNWSVLDDLFQHDEIGKMDFSIDELVKTETVADIAKHLNDGARAARSERNSVAKEAIALLMGQFTNDHPLNKATKHNRGFNHEIAGRFCMPTTEDYRNPDVWEVFRGDTARPPSISTFFYFMYPCETPPTSPLDKVPPPEWPESLIGSNQPQPDIFLRCPLLVQFMLKLLKDPSHPNAVGMADQVTPGAIAWATTLFRYGLGTESALKTKTSKDLKEFDYVGFYGVLLTILTHPHFDKQLAAIQDYWTKTAFPDLPPPNQGLSTGSHAYLLLKMAKAAK